MSKIYHLFVIGIVILSGCNSNSSETDADTRPVVVTTTSIVADIAINLCSDFADVESLMGPGVDPHLYKASHGDIELLTNGDVIIYNGLHLEGKMSQILEKLNPSKTVIAVSDGIDHTKIRTINADANVHDPHIWFDITMWADGVKHVSKELIKKFPDQKDTIESHTKTYLHEMDSVHQACLKLVEALPVDKRILITSHDAFEYFGRSYNFRVRGLQGISTLSESGLKDVTDMVNFIIDNEIKAVFVENSVPQKALRSVIDGCRSKGHDVVVGGELFSDALGADRTPEGTYLGMMYYNVETVINGLK
ncbi:MAG: manganese/zinc/iron transport system substrate-binding protein [Bacteroidia bacterium]|jgi:manganese/zinc/iron transport system substrate-binding protein